MKDIELLQKILEKQDEIFGELKTTNYRLDSVENRLDSMENRLDTMEVRLAKQEEFAERAEQRFSRIEDKLEMLTIKEDLTHKKLNDLSLDMKISERSFKKEIKILKDAQETIITVLQHKNILEMA